MFASRIRARVTRVQLVSPLLAARVRVFYVCQRVEGVGGFRVASRHPSALRVPRGIPVCVQDVDRDLRVAHCREPLPSAPLSHLWFLCAVPATSVSPDCRRARRFHCSRRRICGRRGIREATGPPRTSSSSSCCLGPAPVPCCAPSPLPVLRGPTIATIAPSVPRQQPPPAPFPQIDPSIAAAFLKLQQQPNPADFLQALSAAATFPCTSTHPFAAHAVVPSPTVTATSASSLAHLERLAQTPSLGAKPATTPSGSGKPAHTPASGSSRRPSALPSTSCVSPFATAKNSITGPAGGGTPGASSSGRMYPNRHGSSHGPGKFKEFLDKASEEYNQLSQANQQLRSEMEKLRSEYEAVMRQTAGSTEALFNVNMELQRNVEIVKRLTAAINNFIPMLPGEQQAHAINITERARNVTAQEIMVAQQQQFGGLMPGLFAPGMPAMPPVMANMMANMKPEDAFAAFMGGAKPPGMMMPPHLAQMGVFGGMPPVTSGAQAGASVDDLAGRLMNRPPRSASGTPSKKAKIEVADPEELEIDVQNDDAPPAAHTNGTTTSRKDGRDSAQSLSSRDSATPKSSGNRNSSASLGANFHGANPDVSAILAGMQQQFGGNSRPFLDRLSGANGTPAYSYHQKDGSANIPYNFPEDAFVGANVPKELVRSFELNQGEVVCAVTFAASNDHVYTGGKGSVKLWDISSREKAATPTGSFPCLSEQYIRSIKIFPDNKWMLVGGETSNIVVFDVNQQSVVHQFDTGAQACYALAIAPDSNMCFSCCASGEVILWDMRTKSSVARLNAHSEGASCIDLAPDGNTLWTGGLDGVVRSWDLREKAEASKHSFDTQQVFSLGCSPTQPWVAVGCDTPQVEVINTELNERFVIHSHESCVLSLKYSRTGNYFVTTGKDCFVNLNRAPYGARLFRSTEAKSVLSCDISSDDKFLVTGSGDNKATVYEIVMSM